MNKKQRQAKYKRLAEKYPLLNWRFNIKLIFFALALCVLILAPLAYVQNERIDHLQHKLYLKDAEQIMSYDRYSLQEFEDTFNTGGQSMAYIEAYIVRNQFEDKTIGIGYIKGIKTENCILVESKRAVFCDRTELTFDQGKGLYVEIIKKRVIADYSSLR